MNTIASLISARWVDGLLFAVIVATTVVSLAQFGSWLGRGANIARARKVAVLLAAIFYILALAGIADFAMAGRLNFLNLALFLDGTAGIGILTALMLQSGKGRELRRIAAQDL